MSESLQELVQDDADLTQYAGIGDAIGSAIREIVQTGGLRKLAGLPAAATGAPAQARRLGRSH
jgi:DNA polymerase/3'-5' exonuclease PolX